MSGLTIGLTIDRSHLMKRCATDVQFGMRQLIGTLKQEEPDAGLHASYFNHTYKVIHNGSLQSFDVDGKTEQYSAQGGTALFDAIAQLISSVREANNTCAELKKPRHVAILVMSGGIDENSQEQTASSVNKIVQEARNEGWLCLFLSSDYRAKRTAKECGFAHHSSAYIHPQNSELALREAPDWIKKYRQKEWIGFSDENRKHLSSTQRFPIRSLIWTPCYRTRKDSSSSDE